jgi:hypothetical protein
LVTDVDNTTCPTATARITAPAAAARNDEQLDTGWHTRASNGNTVLKNACSRKHQ